jgi:hypothetical protein
VLTILRPAAATDPGDAIGGSSTPYSRPILADAGRRRTILRAVPASPEEVDEGLRFRYDATAVERVALQGWIGRLAGEATHLASSGAELVFAASTDGGTTFLAADGGALASGGPTLPLDAAGLQQSPTAAVLAPTFRGPATFGLFARGGDGATRPWVGNVAVDFYGIEAPPPPLDPDDPCARVFFESFETYADLDALDAVWAPSNTLPDGEVTWTLATDLVDHGVVALGLELNAAGGAAGEAYRSRTIEGLVPNATYRVTARARFTGARPSGLHIRLGASRGTGWTIADVTTEGTYATLTLDQLAGPSGAIGLRVGVENDFSGLATLVIRFDTITVTPVCP